MAEQNSFDLTLAQACAKAFSTACGVGCTVSDASGELLYECGHGCVSCGICRAANRTQEACVQSHIYGMTEASRFGGKYIYYCPMGLTCFVSPLLGDEQVAAKVTVGPFLMVDRQDYLTFDLMERFHLDEETLARVTEQLQFIPYVAADKVSEMSTLLFMAVGFMNNVSESHRMLEQQNSLAMQSNITTYIQQIKSESTTTQYPYDTERRLMQAVRRADHKEAKQCLNDLLGYVFLTSGGDLEQMKPLVYELLTILSRTTIEAGANPEQTLTANRKNYAELNKIQDFDLLCRWTNRVAGTLMNSIFKFDGVRHANVIHQSIHYVNAHYAERISLEDLARRVYLSPSYFGKVFKEETGETFVAFLNRVRIERSKELLRQPHMRLADIAQLAGFEEQSYFCRVFKKVVGVTPTQYREAGMTSDTEKTPSGGASVETDEIHS